MAYYHCLLLDVDGTLLDFGAAEQKAFHETMEHFGLPATQEVADTYHTINKGLWAALEKGQIKRDKLVVRRFEELLAALERTGDAAAMNTYYLDRLSEHPDPIPGALDAVKELAEVATLAVVTNGVERVQEKRLADSGLNAYMDGVFISERVGVENPTAASLRRPCAPWASRTGARCWWWATASPRTSRAARTPGWIPAGATGTGRRLPPRTDRPTPCAPGRNCMPS